jgi:hypothetical protein
MPLAYLSVPLRHGLYLRPPVTFSARILCGTIQIIDAVKTNDGGRASYITYVIRTGVSPELPFTIMNTD